MNRKERRALQFGHKEKPFTINRAYNQQDVEHRKETGLSDITIKGSIDWAYMESEFNDERDCVLIHLMWQFTH